MAINPSTRTVGKLGEKVALDWLIKKGYKLTRKNYFARYGEVDIICENDTHIVFVEVKYRTKKDIFMLYGRPAHAVNFAKRIHLISAVSEYVHRYDPIKHPRIDVIEIVGTEHENGVASFEITHTENAFDLSGYLDEL